MREPVMSKYSPSAVPRVILWVSIAQGSVISCFVLRSYTWIPALVRYKESPANFSTKSASPGKSACSSGVNGGARNGVISVTSVVWIVGLRSSVPRVSGEIKSLSCVIPPVSVRIVRTADPAGMSVIVQDTQHSICRDHDHQRRSGYASPVGDFCSRERSFIIYPRRSGIGISIAMI